MTHEQITTVEQVISDLETASSRNDVETLVALFAEDATIESYLVSRVFNRKEGVCRTWLSPAEPGPMRRRLDRTSMPGRRCR